MLIVVAGHNVTMPLRAQSELHLAEAQGDPVCLQKTCAVALSRQDARVGSNWCELLPTPSESALRGPHRLALFGHLFGSARASATSTLRQWRAALA